MNDLSHQWLRKLLAFFLTVGMVPSLFAVASPQSDKNAAPIKYESTPPQDRVGKLMRKLEQGDDSIEWDKKFGWLPSVLEKLDVPKESQTLVFSKTSQQHRHIRPSSPRAIYFNEDVYVGYVRRGDFIEIAAVDPVQGAEFYQLPQIKNERAVLRRVSEKCMSCHETSKTKGVPGFLIRSVFPKRTGHPEFKHGTTSTDHTTPFSDRFGGWYVTGSHGKMRHRGNVFVDPNRDDIIDREAGANLKTLPKIARPDSHLEPTSDIVALMLMEHQVQFHNHVARASYTTRQAVYRDEQMNKLFKRETNHRSDTTKRAINSVAEELVDYALFVDEFQLPSPVKGSSKFTDVFMSKAIKTKDGRSLRDLDLKTRLLKHPCSYLIYSKSFNSLPDVVLKVVKEKLLNALSPTENSNKFSHLTHEDKKSILEILKETHPLFAAAEDTSK